MSEPSPLAAALTGGCPRCSERTLFAGWVRFARRCRACGLDYDSFNIGDSAAAFLILIVGPVLTVLSITVVSLPLGLAMTIYGLRFGKALLVHQEYRHRATEGRIAP